jgi:GDP-4-dehydro-6-deoxy-D-mannose reductase
MRVLVTGAGGFVGRHVTRELTASGHEVVACDQVFAAPVEGAADSVVADLCAADAMRGVVQRARPDACLHLGAIAFVPAGQSNPQAMLAVNVLGTVHLLDAVREHAPRARVLVVSTAHVYGPHAENGVLSEDAPMRPLSVYAMSKAAADLASLSYAEHFGLHVMTARPTNHTGPGQSPRFVIPAFIAQLKAIAEGKAAPVMEVGNLESRRDFVDVRDVARAYRLLLERGRAATAYNISSNRIVAVRAVLDRLCEMTGVRPRIVTDPAKFRPTDSSPLLDIGRLQADTGWSPQIDIGQTLKDMLAP